jgi:hypothetical protein
MGVELFPPGFRSAKTGSVVSQWPASTNCKPGSSAVSRGLNFRFGRDTLLESPGLLHVLKALAQIVC